MPMDSASTAKQQDFNPPRKNQKLPQNTTQLLWLEIALFLAKKH